MHKLVRDPVPPLGLDRYQYGRDNWGRSKSEPGKRIPTDEEVDAIWEKLDAMQGGRCAYCEAEIASPRRKIEHFRQRDPHRYPEGTFEWSNLFGACTRKATCDDHKDKCGDYPPEVLIKPDIEDPDRFLVFVTDGSVYARSSLSAQDLRRANETIRILGLNNGALQQIRQSQIAGYKQTATYFAEMAEHFLQDQWLPLLEEEVQRTAHLPFATAIRHVLTNQSYSKPSGQTPAPRD